MARTFADLEARLASSSLRLANADALFEGAVDPVPVIFDGAVERSAIGAMGMQTVSPMVQLPTDSVPALPEGKTVTVGAKTYKIAEHDPDGTGWSTLWLTGGRA